MFRGLSYAGAWQRRFGLRWRSKKKRLAFFFPVAGVRVVKKAFITALKGGRRPAGVPAGRAEAITAGMDAGGNGSGRRHPCRPAAAVPQTGVVRPPGRARPACGERFDTVARKASTLCLNALRPEGKAAAGAAALNEQNFNPQIHHLDCIQMNKFHQG
jgi:hypothetical protein